MPQADLKYSDDLSIDAAKLLAEVEHVILRHDPGAGACKGRAYRAAEFHRTHVFLQVAMLRKPHRDDAFRAGLVADLVALVDRAIPAGVERAVGVIFAPDTYVTGKSGG